MQEILGIWYRVARIWYKVSGIVDQLWDFFRNTEYLILDTNMPSLATNKKAHFDYEFLETFEGGLVLSGPEVKSVKKGSVQLSGSFLHLRNGELWLKHAHVAKYPAAGPQPGYEAQRDRKVLLHRRELSRLMGKLQTKGYTLVPVSLYTKGDNVKIEFALGRGKKQFEKRDVLKKRDVERELKARMKG